MADYDGTSSTISAPNDAKAKLDSLKTITVVCYILYALALLCGVSGLIAIIINYIKRKDTIGTIYESHFTWQMTTFWYGFFWAIIGIITMPLFGIGFIIYGLDYIWVIYRMIKGFLRWSDNKPLYTKSF